jgi:hypothetical protein
MPVVRSVLNSAVAECCWGIRCRTCRRNIVLGTFDNRDFVAKADFYRAGAFQCPSKHKHVYFAEDIVALSPSKIPSHQDIEDNRAKYLSLMTAIWDPN